MGWPDDIRWLARDRGGLVAAMFEAGGGDLMVSQETVLGRSQEAGVLINGKTKHASSLSRYVRHHYGEASVDLTTLLKQHHTTTNITTADWQPSCFVCVCMGDWSATQDHSPMFPDDRVVPWSI
jgi:hypothetical protein